MENAAILLYQGKNILILRKSEGKHQGKWTGPGGHIDWGETPKQAAIRELREETGIEYYQLKGKEIAILRQNKTRIYVVKVKKIPDIKLSEEHDISKVVNIKNIKEYPLTDYFEEVLDYIIENNLI